MYLDIVATVLAGLSSVIVGGGAQCPEVSQTLTLFARGGHPVLKREDRLRKEPFAGFGTVVEDITESGYTKNQPILLGPF